MSLLKRSLVVFAVAICLIIVAGLALWAHHTGIAASCNGSRTGDEPVSCYRDTIFFADWLSLATLAFVLFAVSFLGSWVWALAMGRRRKA
jgi:hypothetical protein